MNLVDKTIGYISPGTALKRIRARQALAIYESYAGASRTKKSLSNYNPVGSDADTTLSFELSTLRNRSRDQERNSPIGGGAINTVVTNVVGTGLKLNSRIDKDVLGFTDDQAEEWQDNTERWFRIYAESCECDVARKLNFYAHQDLAFRRTLGDGDSMYLLPRLTRKGSPFRLKLQAIEADRLMNDKGLTNGTLDNGNTLFEGVEKNKHGAPVRYWIANDHPGSMNRKDIECKSIEAFGTRTGLPNAIHLFRMTRPGQSRGVPYLAPIIEILQQLKRYSQAELDAAVVNSFISLLIETEAGDVDFDTPEMSGTNTGDNDIALGPASVIGLGPGEKANSFNPGRPNTSFDPFVMAMIRQIAIALELPYEVLIKHFSASYSASKAALLEAWRFFSQRRKWLADNFCQVVYEVWMWEAVASGIIKAPGFFRDFRIRKAYLGSQWVGDRQGQIDPVKEVQAAEKRIELKLSTRTEETQSLTGGDFDKNVQQLLKEDKKLKEANLIQDGPVNNPKDGEKNETDRPD